MTREHFMLYTKHFMTQINAKRHKVISQECKKDSTAADKWRRINELISTMQGSFVPGGFPTCTTNPCEWCRILE